MGKEGLARVFAVRIQGSRTHFSNLARSCATAFDMVVYSRFADDDDTMLWLRFRARKRFRREHLSIAQHRRWVAATGLCIGGGQGPCGRKRRELAHFSWEDHLLRLTEAEFKLRYRLNFDSFMDLLHILRADLVVSNEKQARFAKWGQLVMPEVKLAMALRFLAGGSPLDLKLIYHVSTSFVYDSIWLVVDAGLVLHSCPATPLLRPRLAPPYKNGVGTRARSTFVALGTRTPTGHLKKRPPSLFLDPELG